MNRVNYDDYAGQKEEMLKFARASWAQKRDMYYKLLIENKYIKLMFDKQEDKPNANN